ncbi:MAG: DUF2183 domain-containing protein [Bdellovibrionales bacterium]|jgi:hypothetical protein|nr:DUF2183 domain-containing protein [Bdellovibrionales bacterium]MBT3525184.1 DUF2183 domain-containing protein [Bdellovibrionales bacterium]MBT7670428.1 DUF2183 domain-containing protein [Bdellovibrionales bacterium]MBT7766203.1 DUF2183 domain-containing protein [Bdellovibrionales bacterium]
MRKVNLACLFLVIALCHIVPNSALGLEDSNYRNITIISDLDDTIKITNTTDAWSTIGNALYSTDIFSGTNLLYRKMVPKDKGFYLLSASPTFLLSKVVRLLTTHNMPKADITLRNIINQRNKRAYKLNAVRRMIGNSPESEQFILLGDDSNLDPEVYGQIVQENPGRILSVYIHPVKGRDLGTLTGIKTFHTPFDIALYEEMAGRLDTQWVLDLGLEMLRAPAKLLYPNFMSCALLPSIPAPHPSQSRLVKVANLLTNRIKGICK